MGCGVKVAEEDYRKIEEADLVTTDWEKVLGFLKSLLEERRDCTTSPSSKLLGSIRTRAYVEIQTGCDNFCSYCIIPFARGRGRSHSAEKIVQEIQDLEKQDVKEIVLTGINIGAWGMMKTTLGKSQLAEFLEKILKKTKISRIRLSSLGPQYFSDELIDLFSEDRICSHLHLSIQSGSDRILQKMNRHYKSADIAKLSGQLYKKVPDIAITTDIIVGFPEESEEDFQNSCELAKKINLAKIHVFPFSPRKGTVAVKLSQVENGVKKDRAMRLRRIAEQLRQDFMKKQLGKKLNVLFETFQDGYLQGWSENYLSVRVKSSSDLANQIKTIQLKKLEGETLEGVIE